MNNNYPALTIFAVSLYQSQGPFVVTFTIPSELSRNNPPAQPIQIVPLLSSRILTTALDVLSNIRLETLLSHRPSCSVKLVKD